MILPSRPLVGVAVSTPRTAPVVCPPQKLEQHAPARVIGRGGEIISPSWPLVGVAVSTQGSRRSKGVVRTGKRSRSAAASPSSAQMLAAKKAQIHSNFIAVRPGSATALARATRGFFLRVRAAVMPC